MRSGNCTACCIECVTMSAVSFSRVTISLVSTATCAALFGSSAAVC